MNNQSDEPENNAAGDAADSELSDAEFADLDDSIRVEEPVPSRSPLRLSLLAAILSIVSVVFVTYQIFIAEPAVDTSAVDTAAYDDLSSNLQSTNETVRRQSNRIDQLASSNDNSAQRMRKFQTQLEDQLDQRLQRQSEIFESLPDRMSNVENSMSSIQGISTGIRDSWLLAETEYYMQIANAQLQLAGNPHLARLALLQADDRIRQLANPALTNVRRTLSNELRALELVSRPDIEGITLTLASLAEVVASLPLRQQIEVPDEAAPEIENELSGIDRAMASLKSTMNDVVSVRRTDEAVQPLIAPEAAYFLRANLSLQLQVSRLALLRGERVAFQQSLDDSDRWLGGYYDTDSAQVQSARRTIAEIRDSLYDIEMPDISESLRLLRQYNSLSNHTTEPANSRPAEPAPTASAESDNSEPTEPAGVTEAEPGQ